jgi:hypothetical protein
VAAPAPAGVSSLADTFRNWQDVPEAVHGFTEEPVPLSVFVQDRRYLANPPLSLEQYEAVRHIEKVYYPQTCSLLANSADAAIRDYWREPCRMTNLITLEWGKGAGKDHICRTGSLRIAYLLLCLPDPQDYYGMPSQDTIHLLNVASSAPQASRAFFAPMRRVVARPGNWFEHLGVEVVEVRDPRARRQHARQSKVKPLQDEIRFAHSISAVSGHSDADSQEGLNLLAGFMDEVDAFKSRAELAKLRGNALRESSSSAESVLAMLQTSASTRFPEVYKVVRISYPRYLGSTIQQLRVKGEKDIEEFGARSRHYVSGPKATWDVNPRVPGKHVFAEDYREDPVMAAAKYECKPSRAVNPYFANMLAVEACLEEHPEPPLQVAYVRDGHAWKPAYSFARRLYPVRGAAYAIHADMAISRDRAGIALAHVARWDEVTVTGHDERGREVPVLEPRPVVRVDFSAAFEADIGAVPPREIQVRWFRDLVLELIRRGFNVRRATMDNFQSADSLQILEAHGIETDRVSTDLSEEPWRALRNLAYEDRLRGYKDELLLIELAGLSKLPNGKIDHPADGSKDVADAVACACTGAIVLGGSEDPSGVRAFVSSGWAHPEPEEMPVGMGGLKSLAFDGELPDYDVNVPSQVAGPGWLFADTGEAYGGQV